MKKPRSNNVLFFGFPPLSHDDFTAWVLKDLFAQNVVVNFVTEPEEFADKWQQSAIVLVDARTSAYLPQRLKRREGVTILDDAIPEGSLDTRSLSIGADVRSYAFAREGIIEQAKAVTGETSKAFVIGVMGSSHGIGATTLAFTLAEQYRSQGYKTLAVDAGSNPGLPRVADPTSPKEVSRWTLSEDQALPFFTGIEPVGSSRRTRVVTRDPGGRDSPALLELLLKTERLVRDVIVIDIPVDEKEDPFVEMARANLDVLAVVLGPKKFEQVTARAQIDKWRVECPVVTVTSFVEPYRIRPSSLTQMMLTKRPTEKTHATGARWQMPVLDNHADITEDIVGVPSIGISPFSLLVLERQINAGRDVQWKARETRRVERDKWTQTARGRRVRTDSTDKVFEREVGWVEREVTREEQDPKVERLLSDRKTPDHFLAFAAETAANLAAQIRPEMKPPPTKWDIRAEAAQAAPVISRRTPDSDYGRSLTE